MDVVFIRWIVGAKSIGTRFGLDVNDCGAMVRQMLAHRRAGGKSGELNNLDAFERLHKPPRSLPAFLTQRFPPITSRMPDHRFLRYARRATPPAARYDQ